MWGIQILGKKIMAISVNVDKLRPEKNTLVSGNAGNEKNLHLGCHNFFLINSIQFLK